MKLDKKGLTLVELISVLVVLILIFLLAINKVNDLMDETEIKSVKADSISYVKAVNDFFILKNGEDVYPTYEGVFLTDELDTIGIKVSGIKPNSGYIYNVGNKSVYGCLMYEKRRVIINNNEPTTVDRGRCTLIKGYNAIVKTLFADYSGHEEEFVVPENGYYLLEAWGAQGGSYNETYRGGYGAYSSAVISLSEGDILYINVGGQGSNLSNSNYGTNTGGYNGGGNSYYTNNCNNYCGPGGGATSIANVTGTIVNIGTDNVNNIYVVAGGGGGASYRYCNDGDTEYSSGGDGGGILGNSPKNLVGTYSITLPSGGDQSVGGYSGTANNESGGVDGSFGLGGATARTNGGTCGSGGGGGYWGGGSGMFVGSGGGSGYIANPLLLRKRMYCYDCTESKIDNFDTVSTTCVDDSPHANCAKKGNGYARITLVKSLS